MLIISATARRDIIQQKFKGLFVVNCTDINSISFGVDKKPYVVGIELLITNMTIPPQILVLVIAIISSYTKLEKSPSLKHRGMSMCVCVCVCVCVCARACMGTCVSS